MHCICCRQDMPSGDIQMCEICAIWNREEELIRRLEPVWQRNGHYGNHDEIAKMVEAFELKNVYNGTTISWHKVLSLAIGKEVPALTVKKRKGIENEHFSLFHLRNTAQKIGNPMFNGNEILSPSVDIENVSGRRMSGGKTIDLSGGLQVAVDKKAIRFSGFSIEQGSGDILLQMIMDYFREPSDPMQIAVRYNRLHSELCWSEGMKKNNGDDVFNQPTIRSLFTAVGDPNTPPPDYKKFTTYVRKNNSNISPPPLCTWNEKGYLMGLRIDGERKLLPLPNKLNLLEIFIKTWRGRYGSEARKKLRTACYCLSFSFGQTGEGYPLTPHERSFQLLRSIVKANEDRIRCHNNGFLVKGSSGFWWWITHGNGAHGSECVLALADPRVENPGENPNAVLNQICLYESSQELPLGDRICSNVLGLLNDLEISQNIPQVGGALFKARQKVNVRHYFAER